MQDSQPDWRHNLHLPISFLYRVVMYVRHQQKCHIYASVLCAGLVTQKSNWPISILLFPQLSARLELHKSGKLVSYSISSISIVPPCWSYVNRVYICAQRNRRNSPAAMMHWHQVCNNVIIVLAIYWSWDTYRCALVRERRQFPLNIDFLWSHMFQKGSDVHWCIQCCPFSFRGLASLFAVCWGSSKSCIDPLMSSPRNSDRSCVGLFACSSSLASSSDPREASELKLVRAEVNWPRSCALNSWGEAPTNLHQPCVRASWRRGYDKTLRTIAPPHQTSTCRYNAKSSRIFHKICRMQAKFSKHVSFARHCYSPCSRNPCEINDEVSPIT